MHLKANGEERFVKSRQHDDRYGPDNTLEILSAALSIRPQESLP